MTKPTAIIQARIGSTRLPGKVLLKIEGVSLLRRVVERVKLFPGIEQIVVAIPNTKANDPLGEYVQGRGWNLYRGPEKDVLRRYCAAAAHFDADPIIRVTADQPFLDPSVLRLLLAVYAQGGLDLVTNSIERTYPLGLDAQVFSRKLLELADEQATLAHDREHVVPWMFTAPGIARGNVTAPDGGPGWFKSVRWTVDTANDLKFARAVIGALGGALDFTTGDVIGVLERMPGFLEMVKVA